MKLTMKPMKVLSALGVLAAICPPGGFLPWGRDRPRPLSKEGIGGRGAAGQQARQVATSA